MQRFIAFICLCVAGCGAGSVSEEQIPETRVAGPNLPTLSEPVEALSGTPEDVIFNIDPASPRFVARGEETVIRKITVRAPATLSSERCGEVIPIQCFMMDLDWGVTPAQNHPRHMEILDESGAVIGENRRPLQTSAMTMSFEEMRAGPDPHPMFEVTRCGAARRLRFVADTSTLSRESHGVEIGIDLFMYFPNPNNALLAANIPFATGPLTPVQ